MGSFHIDFTNFIYENELVDVKVSKDTLDELLNKVYDNNNKIENISLEKKGKFRFELMEILIRICTLKYLKKEKSYENSIIFLFKNNILENMKRLYSLVYGWKVNSYHTYYMDLTLKHY